MPLQCLPKKSKKPKPAKPDEVPRPVAAKTPPKKASNPKPRGSPSPSPQPERPRVGRREYGPSSSGSNPWTHIMNPMALEANAGGVTNDLIDQVGIAASKRAPDYTGAVTTAARVAMGKAGVGPGLPVHPTYLATPAVNAVAISRGVQGWTDGIKEVVHGQAQRRERSAEARRSPVAKHGDTGEEQVVFTQGMADKVYTPKDEH